jgi:hypothetical protein
MPIIAPARFSILEEGILGDGTGEVVENGKGARVGTRRAHGETHLESINSGKSIEGQHIQASSDTGEQPLPTVDDKYPMM